ncbi:MAG: hypothetical protein AABX70_06285 [Nanoarchaeota archaeon]
MRRFVLLLLLCLPILALAEPNLIKNIKSYKVLSQFQNSPDVKSLHNAWHYSGESFQVADELYHVIHFYRSTKFAIDGSDAGMILELGRCRSQGFRIYCFEEIDNSTQTTTVSYDLQGRTATTKINRSTTRIGDRELLDRVRVGIYGIGPDVRVNRIITPPPHTTAILSGSGSTTRISNYVPNQPITIQTVIQNVGNYPAQHLVYQDPYPRQIAVTSSTASLENNTAILRATLGPGEEKRITYMIVPLEPITHTNTAVITYDFEGVQQNKTAGTLTLEMNHTPYTFSFLPPIPAFTNTLLPLAFTLDNPSSEKIDVRKIALTLPLDLELVQVPIGYTWIPPILSWSGSIPYQSKQSLLFSLRTPKLDTYTISTYLELVTWRNGVASSYSENNTYNFTVSGNSKPLEYTFSITPDTTNMGSSVHTTLILRNKDVSAYKRIQGTITSDGFTQNNTLLLSTLAPGEDKTLLDQNQLTYKPLNDTNRTQTYPVFLNLSYIDDKNTPYTLQGQVYLTLNPPTHLVSVVRTVPSEVERGEEFTVHISLVKDIDSDLSLEIHDERSSDIQLIVGIPYRAFDLTKNEKNLDAYVYKLRVPYDYPANSFQVITQVHSKNKNITQTDVYTIKVKNAPVLAQVNVSNPSSSSSTIFSTPLSPPSNSSTNLTSITPSELPLTNTSTNVSVAFSNGTVQAVRTEISLQEEKKGFFQNFIQFFKDLF